MVERAFQRTLEAALGGKASLVRRADGAWEIAAAPSSTRDEAPRAIEEAPSQRSDGAVARATADDVVAVHVETTGGRSERQRLLWVGLTRTCGGRIEETLETLVNPQARVPDHVVRRLGLDLEALAEALPAGEVLPDVRAFIGEATIAGHNVRAQLGQLNYELLWHGLPAIKNALVDTQDLAAERLPEVARPALAAAARTLGVGTSRSALGGVSRVVAEVYLALDRNGAVRASAGTGRLEQAYRSLPPGASDLPELPGVYVFRDAAGQPLYVGKAASLRARVAQHFTGVSRAVRQDDGLLGRVACVEHEVTPCELEALLRESALIEAWRPPYNTQRAAHGAKTFLQLRGAPFHRAAARADYWEEEGPCFGPYGTSRAVRETMRTLARVFQLRTCLRALPAKRKAMRQPCIRLGQGLCPAPCAGAVEVDQYAVLTHYARLFLSAGREATLDALDGRLSALEWHQHADGWERTILREVRSRLRRVRKVHSPIAGSTAGGRAVLAYPSAAGGWVAYYIEGGELVARRAAEDGGELGPDGHNWPERDQEVQLTASQRNVLLRWLHQHQEDVVYVG